MARRANTSPCSHVQLEWLALKSWPEDRSVIHPPSPNYVEGRNVHIEIRFAAAESFKSLAEELVAAQPDVFLAQTTPADPPKRGRRTASNARLLGRFKVGHGLTGGRRGFSKGRAGRATRETLNAAVPKDVYCSASREREGARPPLSFPEKVPGPCRAKR